MVEPMQAFLPTNLSRGGISGPKKPVDFDSVKIQLASPETLLSWSYGEVLKPETINYRSFKPERDGLFCERIFGPQRDWECHCGKYKRVRYRGVICDRCGVEVTQAKVRRERMGHIELAVPVSHIWFFKSVPSRMGYLLDLSMRNLEKVIYYEIYVVLEPGDAPLQTGDLLTEAEKIDLEEQGLNFRVDMGAPAVKSLLASLDLDELSIELRTQIRVETSAQRKQEALKRLRVVEALRHSENKPEWMILNIVPVIPPDLRPLVPLEGGRFATSDLNDLYRRVINRNNRLKKLIDIKAPEVILRNEKRMLQEAVDAVFDNGRRSRAVRGDGNRALKSLGDMLKGKQGRFRQNLLGKRVDYSGRSVIVVGPELKIHECGLPKVMALELFKPFIIHELERRRMVQTIKTARKMVEQGSPQVWDILEDVIQHHCVLLNRAPTLHRLGIQAFQPVLVEGKAIRIHPLVCKAFNADFDGDQMAVHVPLSFEANIEARVLMLASNNLLSPASGNPLTVPTQDMVLGAYYMTKTRRQPDGHKPHRFANREEALMAFELKKVDLHEEVTVRLGTDLRTTSMGRIVFNDIIPEEVEFVDDTMGGPQLQKLVHRVCKQYSAAATCDFLDRLKFIGHQYATIAGISIGIDDVVAPPQKEQLVDAATEAVKEVQLEFESGIITEGERYNKIIDIWGGTAIDVSTVMYENLSRIEDGFNSVFMMADSNARGSQDQIRQLAGMRGLISKPQKKITGGIGEIIETPITANFREGLSVLEYFVSAHGQRKGLADTALKTAEAGYLTRRMVDVAQDLVITEVDCGTILGLSMTALTEGEEIIVPLGDRILGRVTMDDVVDPATGETVVEMGDQITEELASEITERGIEEVLIRSALTCETRHGVCRACYGRNLATGLMVEAGEAVGVVAAQSIGEPGTQLTLRTFQVGGTAQHVGEQSVIEAKRAGKVRLENVVIAETPDGEKVIIGRSGELTILDDNGVVRGTHNLEYSATLLVSDGQEIGKGDPIFQWDPYNNTLLTDCPGSIEFKDLITDVTFREQSTEGGHVERVVVEQRDRTLNPRMEVLDSEGHIARTYNIPVGGRIMVNEGDQVHSGSNLVKIPRERSKTRDITGGLPRVAELFEARKPKEQSVVTEIDGTVRFGGIVRGSREVLVEDEHGDQRKYYVPYGKHLVVHENDHVRACDRLSEGSVNPHDILRIKGAFAVQEYLVNEIQEVYRLQGVEISDKHIEVIVRQMLQKHKVLDPGDTNFLEGDEVDKFVFADENDTVAEVGGEPATFEPILMGITKASLKTESFISAASFQETTRVLTQAAMEGRTDHLRGLKENVIIGHVVPAGTGLPLHRKAIPKGGDLQQLPEELFDEDEDESLLGMRVLDAG